MYETIMLVLVGHVTLSTQDMQSTWSGVNLCVWSRCSYYKCYVILVFLKSTVGVQSLILTTIINSSKFISMVIGFQSFHNHTLW